MPQISTVSAREVPQRIIQGRGKPESPEMQALRTQIRGLPQSPDNVVKLVLETWENEKTVYQQIRNAAQKEEIPVRTEWHKEDRTYYVYWQLAPQMTAEPATLSETSKSRSRGQRKGGEE